MGVVVEFHCGGCHRVARGSRPLRWRENVRMVAPSDWMVYDPYTRATYCSQCWTEIVTAPRPKPLTEHPGSPPNQPTDASCQSGEALSSVPDREGV